MSILRAKVEFIMYALTFDTFNPEFPNGNSGLKTSYDFNDKQAEGIVEIIKQAHDGADVASKRDIYDLKRDIQDLRNEAKKDTAELKVEIIKWVVSVGVLQGSLIAALLLKLLP